MNYLIYYHMNDVYDIIVTFVYLDIVWSIL